MLRKWLSWRDFFGGRTVSRELRWYAVVVIGLLVATGVRVAALDAQSFTFDEADRVVLASLPLGESLVATSREGLHVAPLLHVLLRPFVQPLNETWTRLPSALLGVLTVALVAALAKKWLGPTAGLMALWLMALNPFHIWFSRMATMYSLLLVGVCGAMWAFSLLLERPSRQRWIALGSFTFIGVFTHHFGLAVPLIQFLYLLATFRRNHRLFVPWVITEAVALFPLAAWLFWGSQMLGVHYIGSAAALPPELSELIKTLWNFSFGYTGEVTVFTLLALALYGGVGLFGFIYAVRRHGPSYGRLIAVWFALPIGVAFVLSLRLPMYIDRYLSPALPAFVLLLTLGLRGFRQPVRRGVLIGLLLISSISLTRIYFDREFYAKEDWRGAVNYVQAREQSGDVLLNVRREWLMPVQVYYSGQAPLRGIAALKDATPMADLTNDAERVWLVWPHQQDLAHLLAKCQPFEAQAQAVSADQVMWMQQHAAQLVEQTEWTCISVFLYDLRRSQGP